MQQLTLSEYADVQRSFGVKVFERHGQYWREVRPTFFRPVLPLTVCAAQGSERLFPWPASFQYVIDESQQANSSLGFLVLDDLRSYGLETVDTRRRYLIKQGARHFSVREIVDPAELKQHGHRAYLSFFERTRYSYRSDRRKAEGFGAWVDALFSNPKVIVLGGFGEDGLAAVSTSYWVDSTLILATFFGESGAMKRNVGEIMLHELRLRAAREQGIREIFLRSYQGGNSLDRYYMIRGGRLVQKPARLEMPAPVRFAMRAVMPGLYAQLLGRWPEGPGERS